MRDRGRTVQKHLEQMNPDKMTFTPCVLDQAQLAVETQFDGQYFFLVSRAPPHWHELADFLLFEEE